MENPAPQKPKRLKKGRPLKLLWFLIVAITVGFFWYFMWMYFSGSGSYDDELSYLDDEYSEDCNVLGIALYGDLYTYASEYDPETNEPLLSESSSEDIVFQIEWAEEDKNTKAILLEIDSYGGGPVAAEEVEKALNRATKPTVALIREVGDSAAYWAATGADVIFASELSEVGSIGVTMSYVDMSEFNRKEGFVYNELSTGKFKDTGDPEKPLTAEERTLLERDLQIIHDAFVKAVAENRELDVEKVEELADGSAMLGRMALENGLIDRIGGEHEVKEYLKEKIGEEVEICW